MIYVHRTYFIPWNTRIMQGIALSWVLWHVYTRLLQLRDRIKTRFFKDLERSWIKLFIELFLIFSIFSRILVQGLYTYYRCYCMYPLPLCHIVTSPFFRSLGACPRIRCCPAAWKWSGFFGWTFQDSRSLPSVLRVRSALSARFQARRSAPRAPRTHLGNWTSSIWLVPCTDILVIFAYCIGPSDTGGRYRIPRSPIFGIHTINARFGHCMVFWHRFWLRYRPTTVNDIE